MSPTADRVFRRLLANGPLTAVPKRPSDQHHLVTLAAAQFEPGKDYREAEVNDTLSGWLETFCEPYAIDHVTLRRLLVDSRLLSRTTSGSTYRVNPDKIDEIEAVSEIEPAALLAQVLSERETRKREHS